MLFKTKIKTKLYVTKIFGNDVAAICEGKVTIKLNKPPYVGMRILDLSKILMFECHYDYIKNKHSSKSESVFKINIILIVWYMKSKPKMIMKILVRIKNCLTYVIIQLNQKIMMIQTNNSKAGCVAIEDLVGLKTKMDSFLAEDIHSLVSI